MISVLCPSRKRPAQLRRMVESLGLALKYGAVEVIVYADADDPETVELARELRIKYHVGPRLTMSALWDPLIPLADGDIFMQGNDDVVFRTDGWHVLVDAFFAASEDKIWMVHGSDGTPRAEAFGPHPIVHRRWVETVGYFIPPYFSSDYGDTWVNYVADRLGRRKYLPFLVEHMHYAWGKAARDETTEERLLRHARDLPGETYNRMAPEREADVEKLRAMMIPAGRMVAA